MKLNLPLLVPVGVILIQLLCPACSRPTQSSPSSHGNLPAIAVPALMKRNESAGVYYVVPKCITAQINATTTEEHSIPCTSEEKGKITSFGREVLLEGKAVLWQNNKIYYNNKLYSDPTGKLAEYSQYIVLYHKISNAEQFYILLSELDEKIDTDGYLDVNKLTLEQRADVLASRKWRNDKRRHTPK